MGGKKKKREKKESIDSSMIRSSCFGNSVKPLDNLPMGKLESPSRGSQGSPSAATEAPGAIPNFSEFLTDLLVQLKFNPALV